MESTSTTHKDDGIDNPTKHHPRLTNQKSADAYHIDSQPEDNISYSGGSVHTFRDTLMEEEEANNFMKI